MRSAAVALVAVAFFAGCTGPSGGLPEADLGDGENRYVFGWRDSEQSQSFAGRRATLQNPSEAPLRLPMEAGGYRLVWAINVSITWTDDSATAGTAPDGDDRFALELEAPDGTVVARAEAGPSPREVSWVDTAPAPDDVVVAADSAADANATLRARFEESIIAEQWTVRAVLEDTGDTTGLVDSGNSVTFTVTLRNREPVLRP